jgi:DNA topoisomerase-1
MTATEREWSEECAPPPEAAAAAAGLRYVNDGEPGIAREPLEGGFRYRDAGGREIADEAELARFRSLGIPPAWRDVWICADADGHLQATGRDARGRKQYRYHPRWREIRDENKYERLAAFGRALPALRERVDRDLGRPGLPREKVVAAVVRLLERTHIRVGNVEYARDNKSYGLTTMRDQHVKVEAGKIRFAFKGKSGVRHAISLSDRRLAKIVQRCRDLPGQHLFQYLDEAGERQAISSSDVNAYLRDLTGQPFTAKDFRTWAGSVQAASLLRAAPPEERERDAKRQVTAAIEQVAARLGNTPAVCRRCYVHPAVIDAYMGGALAAAEPAEPIAGLDDDEELLLTVLAPAREA